ncbi:MAG: universal stress protein [Acidobacteria bacterium]|nr:universal stress protein [Acidobacteriota bacterium]
MRHTLRTVLIGTSLTDASDQVVRDGLRLARAAHARVHLVHAFQATPAPGRVAPGGAPAHATDLVEARRQARRGLLEAQIARLGVRPDELVDTTVLEGATHLVLAEAAAAAGADLIVVAASESRGHVGKLLGSTADRLVRVASCPVLVTRGLLAVPPRHLLFGVDLSPLSGEALARGLELASCLGGRPAAGSTAAGAWRGPQAPGVAHALLVLEAAPLLRDEVQDVDLVRVDRATVEALDELVDERCPPGWHATPLIRTGTFVAGRIVEMGEDLEADLLVVGTHGRHAGSRFLIGSVAEAVLRNFPKSVLVVPPASVAV